MKRASFALLAVLLALPGCNDERSAALDAARSGDVGGAVRTLRSLRLPDGSYDVDFTTVALDRRDVGGSLITPVPGVSVDGSITDLDAPD